MSQQATATGPAYTPTQTQKMPQGVKVHVYGQPCNGRIEIVSEEEMLQTPEKKALMMLWSTAFKRDTGLSKIYMPTSTACNAQVCSSQDMRTKIRMNGTVLFRSNQIKADVMMLPDQWSVLINRVGGCPVIVMVNKKTGETWTGHAARWSLFDKGSLEGKAPREHFSVVDTLMAQMPAADPDDIEVRIVTSVHPLDFEHRIMDGPHVAINRKLVDHILENLNYDCIYDDPTLGQINLPRIISSQFAKHKVFNVQFDGNWTDLKDADGKYRFWDCTRGEQQRNLVAVYRESL